MKLFENHFECQNIFDMLDTKTNDPVVKNLTVKVTSFSVYQSFKNKESFYTYLTCQTEDQVDFFKGFVDLEQAKVLF